LIDYLVIIGQSGAEWGAEWSPPKLVRSRVGQSGAEWGAEWSPPKLVRK